MDFQLASLASAQRLIGRKATVCIASNNVGPVTFGWRRPVILLPESFLDLDEEAQRGILCHELLHIRRHDWLVSLFEECIAACLWFHPAVWYLLGQARLAREQIVDVEVIRVTAATDPYVHALLAMAGAQLDCGPMPASAFLRNRHLVQRLRCLLAETRIAPWRLASSYLLITIVLAGAGSLAFSSFPLMGEGTTRRQELGSHPIKPPSKPPALAAKRTSMKDVLRVGRGVTAPRLIARVDPQYSDTARERGIEGTVVVQGIVEADSRMSVNKIVRSLDPQLDLNAARAMEQWTFEPGRLRGAPVPVELHVEIDFRLSSRKDTEGRF